VYALVLSKVIKVEMPNYKCFTTKKCPASLSLGEGTRVRLEL